MNTIELPEISENLENKFSHLWHLVGNTPMLELKYTYKGKPGSIYVKCEHYNLTGSVKDRMALYIMYQAYKNGKNCKTLAHRTAKTVIYNYLTA